MAVMKTPGVYIVEKNAFPNSVVEVATAVPAFIGYTEKAEKNNKSLTGKPIRITSMAEFRTYFGDAPNPKFTVSSVSKDAPAEADPAGEGEDAPETPQKTEAAGNKLTVNKNDYVLNREDKFSLFYNLLMFYANGGGPCYIVSVGDYQQDVKADVLKGGIAPLVKEQEPTMVVIPEAVNLNNAADCYSIQQEMLSHCGYVMQNRFAVLDVFNGYKDRNDEEIITQFREGIGSNFLNYGAAYYPWVNSTVVAENDISFENIMDLENLKKLLKLDLDMIYPSGDVKKDEISSFIDHLVKTKNLDKDQQALADNERKEQDIKNSTAHKVLVQMSPLYRELMKEMRRMLNMLPASAAMAGIYTMVDNTKGVWRAPANVSVATVESPTVNICHEEQEDLNVPINGKAVNAIRFFTGEGIKVWGARTLDGNSLDWRYINVRRTMIMLEESVKNAAKAYVFDPNDANTWVNMKSMIGNFLNGIWKRGGLAGSSPDDAYSVHVGLGETMTAEDILEGILRVTVLVAIVRPAEFIEITFQQQMQKS
ncbi:MAG: phage tail sheath family protein [Bacteroidales bacterium]|jgi:phage tail sheath protein FI|nr:phage tail sheath family protein [Bacteroidales bacterium]